MPKIILTDEDKEILSKAYTLCHWLFSRNDSSKLRESSQKVIFGITDIQKYFDDARD